MCSNTWSSADGAVLKGCRNFRKQSLAGGSRSLWAGLETLKTWLRFLLQLLDFGM